MKSGSAPASIVAYENSITSTSGADYYYPCSRSLRNLEDTVPAAAQLPRLPQAPRPSASSSQTSSPPLGAKEEDVAHLCGPLLQPSLPSVEIRDSLHDQTSPLQPANIVSSSSHLVGNPEELYQRSCSAPSSRLASPTVSTSENSKSNRQAQSSPLRADSLDFSESQREKKPSLPPRVMVRRTVIAPVQHSPVMEQGAAAPTTVEPSHVTIAPALVSTVKVAAVPDGGGALGAVDAATHIDLVEPRTASPPPPAGLLSSLGEHSTYADIDAAGGAAAVASGLSTNELPIRETFPIPRYCPDDLLRGEDKLWCPGKPLRIAYITWNMANKEPRMDEVSAYCIHPNAHLVVVGTQENGPYIGSNKQQKRWAKTVRDRCLGGQYELMGQHHMWAVQMLVFARKRDVAKYVSRSHASHVKTGMMHGLGGNKGGVAVGIVLSLTPKFVEPSHVATTQRAATTAPSSPRGERTSLPSRSVHTVSMEATVAASGGREGLDDAVNLSRSTVAGVLPSVLPSESSMQHDADAEDMNTYHRRLQEEIPRFTEGNDRHYGIVHNAAELNEDELFSPAEAASTNASFDGLLEQHLGQVSKRQMRRSFKREDRARGGAKRGNIRNSSPEDERSDEDLSGGTPNSRTPNYMTLLFVTAHLAAHQGAVVNRNKDYREIVHGLRLGRRGPQRKFFKSLLRQRQVLGDVDGAASDDDNEHGDEDSSEDDVVVLSLPVVSAIANRAKARRDVTEEFDLTFFGGDLNYRINGTRKAIEYVIQHHRNIRSILINNDQLSLERARGTVFQGYQEGNLLFRPTYKYEVSPSNGGVTLNEYNFSRKKDRMPAYCDRVLFKKNLSSAARRVVIRLYTDVPNVRTSDHRPVVALFDVGTRAFPG
ncbi:putative endonuclease/exonuclease/phosphatase [Leptomonas seymouri]|uniref:Putative endonuclease/exonuclease/phosphatase n=1 Tax=Leptomonas seymouri TaxID=5684 RepID=A0A0N1PEB1_LEPSE|nr:putative endonuclease/exonuclease/phosphatase [Leptomonas seymouri]|eukprot:KPI86754.1 putative endonuclease/exonuclease/phosphatase [Leptomonas seymouri]